MATAPAISRIVRTDTETSTLRRSVSLAPEGDSAATIWASYQTGWMTYSVRDVGERQNTLGG